MDASQAPSRKRKRDDSFQDVSDIEGEEVDFDGASSRNASMISDDLESQNARQVGGLRSSLSDFDVDMLASTAASGDAGGGGAISGFGAAAAMLNIASPPRVLSGTPGGLMSPRPPFPPAMLADQSLLGRSSLSRSMDLSAAMSLQSPEPDIKGGGGIVAGSLEDLPMLPGAVAVRSQLSPDAVFVKQEQRATSSSPMSAAGSAGGAATPPGSAGATPADAAAAAAAAGAGAVAVKAVATGASAVAAAAAAPAPRDVIDLTDSHDEGPVKKDEKKKKKRKKADEIRFEDLKFEEKIGEGSFGEVFRGYLWGQEVALKKLRIKVEKDWEGKMKEFKKEVKIMRTLRHPNIVEFLGVCVQPEVSTPIIVTEYLANGSLEDVLEKKAKEHKRLSMKRTITLAKDIACGLNWLHHKGIIHRDLKTANILLDPNWKGKIADFGLSHVKKSKYLNAIGTYGVCGTPCYTAPEVLKKQPYGVKADVFSFAIVLCELILGKYPYENEPESTKSFEMAIVSGLRPDVPPCSVPALTDLIQACWAELPEDRPAMDDIIATLDKIEREHNELTNTILDEVPEEIVRMLEEEKKRVSSLTKTVEMQKLQLAQAQRQILQAKRDLDTEKRRGTDAGLTGGHDLRARAGRTRGTGAGAGAAGGAGAATGEGSGAAAAAAPAHYGLAPPAAGAAGAAVAAARVARSPVKTPGRRIARGKAKAPAAGAGAGRGRGRKAAAAAAAAGASPAQLPAALAAAAEDDAAMPALEEISTDFALSGGVGAGDGDAAMLQAPALSSAAAQAFAPAAVTGPVTGAASLLYAAGVVHGGARVGAGAGVTAHPQAVLRSPPVRPQLKIDVHAAPLSGTDTGVGFGGSAPDAVAVPSPRHGALPAPPQPMLQLSGVRRGTPAGGTAGAVAATGTGGGSGGVGQLKPPLSPQLTILSATASWMNPSEVPPPAAAAAPPATSGSGATVVSAAMPPMQSPMRLTLGGSTILTVSPRNKPVSPRAGAQPTPPPLSAPAASLMAAAAAAAAAAPVVITRSPQLAPRALQMPAPPFAAGGAASGASPARSGMPPPPRSPRHTAALDPALFSLPMPPPAVPMTALPTGAGTAAASHALFAQSAGHSLLAGATAGAPASSVFGHTGGTAGAVAASMVASVASVSVASATAAAAAAVAGRGGSSPDRAASPDSIAAGAAGASPAASKRRPRKQRRLQGPVA